MAKSLKPVKTLLKVAEPVKADKQTLHGLTLSARFVLASLFSELDRAPMSVYGPWGKYGTIAYHTTWDSATHVQIELGLSNALLTQSIVLHVMQHGDPRRIKRSVGWQWPVYRKGQHKGYPSDTHEARAIIAHQRAHLIPILERYDSTGSLAIIERMAMAADKEHES